MPRTVRASEGGYSPLQDRDRSSSSSSSTTSSKDKSTSSDVSPRAQAGVSSSSSTSSKDKSTSSDVSPRAQAGPTEKELNNTGNTVRAGSGGYSPLQDRTYRRDLATARDKGTTVDAVRGGTAATGTSRTRDTRSQAEVYRDVYDRVDADGARDYEYGRSPLEDQRYREDLRIARDTGTTVPYVRAVQDHRRTVRDAEDRAREMQEGFQPISSRMDPEDSLMTRGAAFGVGAGILSIGRRIDDFFSRRMPDTRTLIPQYQEQWESGDMRPDGAMTVPGVIDRYEAPFAGTRDRISQTTGPAIQHQVDQFTEQPATYIGRMGLYYGGGAAFGVGARLGTAAARGAAGRLATRSPAQTQFIPSFLGRAAEPAVGIGTTGLVAYDIGTAKSPEAASDKIMQYGAAGYGAQRGWRAGTGIIDRVQTRGRQYVPLDKITDAQVATGQQAFPLTRTGQRPGSLVQEFRSSRHGLPGETGVNVWHGTPGRFRSGTQIQDSVMRSTDMPGLYVSPRASPYFTRAPHKATQKYSLLGDQEPIRPTMLRVGVDDVTRLPPGARGIDPGRQFLRTGAKKDTAYITPSADRAAATGRVEAEAVIPPGAILTGGKGQFYTKVGDRRVPIDQFAAGPSTPVVTAPTGPGTRRASDFMSTYYRGTGTRKGIISPDRTAGLSFGRVTRPQKPATTGRISPSTDIKPGITTTVRPPTYDRVIPPTRRDTVTPIRRTAPTRTQPMMTPRKTANVQNILGTRTTAPKPDLVGTKKDTKRRKSPFKIGARTREHYVVDPSAFLGVKKRKR